jgi:hypothetical protein
MTRTRAAAAGLWFALVLPSSFIVSRYFGWTGLAVYAAGVAAVLALDRRLRVEPRARACWRLGLATFAAVIVMFAAVYPVANIHVPGAGSDDDDGLNMATRAMFSGHFPYVERTYLGNLDHHLPGSFVLAAPFVLAGTSALQNLFWLPMFFLAVSRERDEVTALKLAWLALLLSPAIMYEVVTGTGYVSNAISVALGLWCVARATRWKDAAAAVWGVALASRANFLFLLPIAFGYLQQHAGAAAARRAVLIASATAAALILPFYLYDPRHFSPIEGANRLLVFDGMAPHLGAALLAATGVLAVALGMQRMDRARLFGSAAILQAFPILSGIVLTSAWNRRVDLTYARYGAFFAWFAFMAIVARGTMPLKSQCPRQPNDA